MEAECPRVTPVCSQDFISEHSSAKLNSFANWKPVDSLGLVVNSLTNSPGDELTSG